MPKKCSAFGRIVNPMSEELKLALGFVKDLTGQLITISTFILGFTVTFAKEYLDKNSSRLSYLAIGSWILLFLSILFGIVALMALLSTVAPVGGSQPIELDKVRFWSGVQITMFIFGLLLMIVFAISVIMKQLRSKN